MKSLGLSSKIILLIACFSIHPAFGQISQHLYRTLPDTLRPVHRERITLKELQKILINRTAIKSWGSVEYQELKSLCHQLGPKYGTIANVQDRLQFLLAICSTLYDHDNLYSGKAVTAVGRKASYQIENAHVVTNLKLVDSYIEELKKYRPADKTKLPGSYYFKAFFQFENGNYAEAIKNSQLGLTFAKELNDQSVSKYYLSFAYFYSLLDLPTQSLVYCDSAWATVNMLPQKPSEAANERTSISSFKQKAYLSLFIRQPRSVYADSIWSLHKQLTYDSYTKGRRKASSFIILAGLSFYQQNYRQTLAHLDSAQLIFPNLHLLIMWQEGMIYKGLSLLRLGREQEAKAVLGLLNFENIQTPALALALQELISFEKHNQNQDKVLHYQDMLLAFNQKRHALEMEGKALEMSQKYSIASRDDQIFRLTELRERERWIAFFIILSITLLVIILLIRYLNTKAKTNRLVQQIDEITELQLAQIEEVQLLERKRIGQELHDDLTASIAMATRYLVLKADQSNDTSEKKQTMQVVKTLEESYNLTRMKSHRLFQEDNARQFCDRLAAETELLFIGTRIQFTFTGEISGLILSAEFKTTLVMVIKEAMTNIIKHANASQASIVLYYDQESLILEISDNGKGMATDRFNKGIGLKTVQNRIMSLGGTLTIHSAKPTGTSLDIRIPLPSEATYPFDVPIKQTSSNQ